MGIFQVCGCAVCAAVVAALLKRTDKELALLLSIAACTVIFTAAASQLSLLVEQITAVATQSLAADVLPPVLKAVGIAVVGQLAVNACKDAGESAMAYTVQLAAKIAVLAVSLPLLTQVFKYIEEIMKL